MNFRTLNEQEEKEFREYARETFNPSTDTIEYEIWHPIMVEECEKMIAEKMKR